MNSIDAALRGRRVLIPVTKGRRELADALRDSGAQVDEAEMIKIVSTSDPSALADAVSAWCRGHYTWLVVTSRNAVTALTAQAERSGLSLGEPQPGSLVAAVGDSTAAECMRAGLTVSARGAGATAAGLLAQFESGAGRVLVPLGNLASDALATGLREKGWSVDVVEAYVTIAGPGLAEHTRRSLVDGEIDAVVLTSASVARRLVECLDGAQIPASTMVVAIGPSTADQARAAGISVSAVSPAPHYEGILESLRDVLGS